jgi:hypothetical protein
LVRTVDDPSVRGMIPGRLCHKGDCCRTTLVDFRLKKPARVGPTSARSHATEGKGLIPVQPEKQVACVSGTMHSLTRWLHFVQLQEVGSCGAELGQPNRMGGKLGIELVPDTSHIRLSQTACSF